MTIEPDRWRQTHQCFRNIAEALAQAGCTLDDVVRVHYLLTDAALFEPLAPVFGQYFHRARPAATAMVVGLVDPRMKIEIEVTARRRREGALNAAHPRSTDDPRGDPRVRRRRNRPERGPLGQGMHVSARRPSRDWRPWAATASRCPRNWAALGWTM
jgi:hypothetical protein